MDTTTALRQVAAIMREREPDEGPAEIAIGQQLGAIYDLAADQLDAGATYRTDCCPCHRALLGHFAELGRLANQLDTQQQEPTSADT